MELQLGLDTLLSYKRLPYTAWHALAEFVDNSTQAYFNNREALDRAYAEEGSGLEVAVVYDRNGDGLLRVSDNAIGMSYAELQRAMRVGLPPEDPSGRSRYGLGMKMAACWYGDLWTVTTKKLGETVEYTVKIDVNRVASGDATLEESQVTGLPASQHYTRIEITQLNRKPQGRTLGKVKDFLAAMYRLDIEKGDLTFLWQGTPLVSLTSWDFLKDTLGGEYKKDFEFEVNGKRAWGWVGVLNTGGRPKAGFAMIHNGRMIKTWPDAWHPESLYGQQQGSNDLINQRLVGEIYLDNFDVSHTKDDIHWHDDEEDAVQDKLREVCGEYRDVARAARKTARLGAAAIQMAAKEIQAELRSPEMGDFIEAEPPAPELIEADERALIEETDLTSSDFSAALSFRGSVVEVVGLLDTTKSANDPYVISEASQPDRVIVVINMNHPHLASIDENGLLNYFRHCTYDALAEWRARNQSATIDPGTVKRLKDQFLRLHIEIEMHDED